MLRILCEFDTFAFFQCISQFQRNWGKQHINITINLIDFLRCTYVQSKTVLRSGSEHTLECPYYNSFSKLKQQQQNTIFRDIYFHVICLFAIFYVSDFIAHEHLFHVNVGPPNERGCIISNEMRMNGEILQRLDQNSFFRLLFGHTALYVSFI